MGRCPDCGHELDGEDYDYDSWYDYEDSGPVQLELFPPDPPKRISVPYEGPAIVRQIRAWGLGYEQRPAEVWISRKGHVTNIMVISINVYGGMATWVPMYGSELIIGDGLLVNAPKDVMVEVTVQRPGLNNIEVLTTSEIN